MTMVRVAIVFLVFAPQAWSLNVSSVADEAPSLLQGAFQTMASADAPLAELEEQVGENPPKQGGDESLDETQPGADVDGLSQLQHLEESKEESHEDLEESQLGAIQPEKGDEMPGFPKSFPGCGCDWEGKAWTCKGTIAHPASLQGNECCCCTLKCSKDNRCTNEQCLAIGVDQGPEIAAEEARRKAILGDADAVIGDLPAYKVSLGIGRPNGAKILAMCKAKNMVPLCDASGAHYCGRTPSCYHPACKDATSPFAKTAFSAPVTMVTTDIDPTQFYGLAMYASYYGGARANQPHGGALTAVSMSHSWIIHLGTIQMMNMQTRKPVKAIPVSQVDSGQALGGWHTYCVKEEANR